MTLKNGTSYINLANIDIINACAKNRVKTISIDNGKLSIEFYERPYQNNRSTTREVLSQIQPELDFNPAKVDNDNSIGEAGSTEAFDITEEVLINMLHEDPLEYEKVMKEMCSHD